VLDTVREALTELADQGPRPADLAAARMQAKMRLILNREQPLEHARLLAQRTFAGTLDWSVEQELAALDTVDDAGVRAAAARIVTDLLTVVSPEA
jgi:predicted Zn-dependent peptidase